MIAVLISIPPKWCEKIATGKKTIEVRKTRPKIKTPFKCYIYCTYGRGLIQHNDEILPDMLIEQKVSKGHIWSNCCNGKVIGEFVCDEIKPIQDYTVCIGTEEHYLLCGGALEGTGMTGEEVYRYGKGKPLFGWHISDLKIYDTPKELGKLGEFVKENVNCFDMPCQCCKFYHDDKDGLFDCDNILTRPPQSWCYVEELEELK